MRKNLLAALLLISAVFVFTNNSNAQGTLIHYWNFNNFTTTYSYAYGTTFPIGPIDADFSIHDTSKARIYMATFPGTSPGWHSIFTSYMDPDVTVAADADTVNLRMGQTGGTAIRPRNPCDSNYLLFYIPTNNYQNIRLTWGAESSSLASGDTYEVFDYSVDSGVTWITAGLSEPQDSAGLAFRRISVTFSNPLVNNNPKLVFRMHFVGHNTGSSGNNRIDNVTVDGDSIIAPVVIHYWDFNTYATTYTYSPTLVYPLGPIHADYSAINTATTGIWFGTDPGTSSSWHSAEATVMDPVATVLADYDTVNVLAPPGVTPGVSGAGSIGIRPRNPLDSAYLYYYIPTTGYHNISLTWGAESSSTTSGDGEEWFDYSIDSGATWRSALLSEPFDSAWTVFKRISVTFTSDSGVNNNPKLVFRIHFINHNTGTSGNNRIDNISVNGIPYIVSTSITTTAASFGPFCNASANPVSVAYTSNGTFTGTWSVQLSNSAGSFASGTTIIGTGASSPISASIPSGTAAGTYRVRVLNTSPAINSGNDNGTNIIINAPPAAHNVTGSAAYCAGGTGVAIGLNGSQSGVRYYLYRGGSYINDSLNGSGGVISFGNVTTGGTYTVVATNTVTPTCTSNMTGSAVVTVNPVPSAIAGNVTICAGNTEVLSDALTGGTWSSGFTTAATINATSGMLTANAPGLSVITYTMPTGCFTTTNVIINGAVPAIGSVTSVCTGQTTALTEADGGTWASSNTALATIDPYAGIVGGVGAGSPVITFTTTIGCIVTTAVTINQTPPAIGGLSSVCVGSTISLTDGIGGGTWSSSDGTANILPVLGTVTGVSPGSPTITYTLPGGCIAVTSIVVNPLPLSISGTPVVCVGSTTALTEPVSGTWSSSAAASTVDGSGNVTGVSAGNPVIIFTLPTGCQTIASVTVNPLPAPITGITNVCATLTTSLSDATTGGSWSNDVNASIDPVTGIVTGVTAGTSAITYALPTGCVANTTVVVNALPDPISGNTNACQGQITSLTDLPLGGTWSSDNTHVNVGVSSGALRGITPGTSVITYMLPTGCLATTSVTVNPLSVITGLTAICSGLSSTLSDATSGGTWASDNMTAVSIDPVSGSFNAPNSGFANITYTLSSGCVTTSSINVSLSPASIAGDTVICTGTSGSLVDLGGGRWRSSNTLVANVGSGTGLVSGITAGTTTITYVLGSGCSSHQTVTINQSPSAITGITAVCASSIITLHDPTPGGSWSSTAGTGVATIDATMGVTFGVTPGNSTITYTTPSGCIASTVIVINPLPAAIRGIASFCVASESTLGDSTVGGAWSSSSAVLATISASTGVISGVSAGYPLISYTLPTGCVSTIVATVNPLPTVFTTTGGGSYCAGTGGLHIGLSGSVPGIMYQLYYGVTHVGSPIAGTSLPLDFGAQTLVEVYTITAINAITGCADNMAGTAPVVENSLPATHSVTGGGHFCSGGTGVHIGLDGSNAGISYQLFNAGVSAGFPVAGSTGAVDFGAIATAGWYTVVATNSATGCTDNMIDTATVTIDPTMVPSVTLSTGASETVCAGSLLTITAITVNGGPTPVYSWTVNGVSASVSGGTYRYLPSDGDIVVAALTSSATCAVPAMVSSSSTLSVLATGAPSIHITASPDDTVCNGTLVHFANTSSFGGSAPVFVWVVNGFIASSTAGYSYTPANGDAISCILVSNYQCRTSDSGLSNHINMSVAPSLAPVVTVSAAPGSTVAHGQSVTLYAGVTNGGPAPYYQWYVNGSPVAGAVFASFVDNNVGNSDSVRCEVTSSGVCSGLTGNGGITLHVSYEGIQQILSAGSDIRLLPNPNSGSFSVKGNLGTTNDEEVTLIVTDMLGQVIYNTQVMPQNGNIDAQINLANNLANGMYLLNMHTASQNVVFHFVMER